MSTVDQRPKHKPSPKRTLEEVLHSLQDLIRNELIEKSKPGTPPTRARPRFQAGYEAQTTDLELPSSDDIQTALHSLEGLITHELEDRDDTPSKRTKPGLPMPDMTTPVNDTISSEPETEHEHDARQASATPPADEAETSNEVPAFGPFDETMPDDNSITEELTLASSPGASLEFEDEAGEDTIDPSGRSGDTMPPEGLQEMFSFESSLPPIEPEETILEGSETTEVPPDSTPTEPPAVDSSPHTAADDNYMRDNFVEFENSAPAAVENEPQTPEMDDKPTMSSTQNSDRAVVPAGDERGAFLADIDVEAESGLTSDMVPDDLNALPSIEFDHHENPLSSNGVRPIDEAADLPPEHETDTKDLTVDLTAPEVAESDVPPDLDVTPPTDESKGSAAPTDEDGIVPLIVSSAIAALKAAEEASEAPPTITETSEPVTKSPDTNISASIEPKTFAEEPESEAQEMQRNPENIPVLDEIATSASKQSPTMDAASPPPNRARDIAVKTIAKLNIELRRCGERTLPPQLVDRLQYLLHEMLEQSAPGASEGNSVKHAEKQKMKP